MRLVRRIALLVIVGLILAVPAKIHADSQDSQKWMTQTSEADERDSAIYVTYSDFGGMHFETTAYGRDLEGFSKWEEGQELPVSMAKVRFAAQQTFRKQFPQFQQFRIDSIKLTHLAIVDDWIFDVIFDGTDFATFKGASDEKNIHLFVLLNGRVIAPVESKK
jgi:Ni/Co efflux regulator RcnB